MVSSLGQVKSLNFKHTGKEKILKQGKNKAGYLLVYLYKNRVRKKFFVHRLVAEVFIQNPDNFPQCNHLDENKQNNCSENLCWCTAKENCNWGTHNKKISKSMTNNPKISTPIKCLDLEINEITYYPSIQEASRQLNVRVCSIWASIHKNKKPYKN